MKHKAILELRLLYVYLKSLLFCKRFWLIPFVYRLIIDIKTLRLIRFKVLSRNDCFTIIDVFCYQNYSLLGEWDTKLNNSIEQCGDSPVVLDLGANLGYTSHYLKLLYPKSFFIGVEPDTTAVKLCKLHGVDEIFLGVIGTGLTEFINDDAISYAKRLSSHGNRVDVISETFLLERIKEYTPFILKVDIEGAEKILFRDYKELVSKFRIVFVELHDWTDDHTIYSAPIWDFLAENDGRYKVFVKGDILCLVKIL